MTRPKFSTQISLGNYIQMGLILVAMTAAFYLTKYQAESNTAAVSEIRSELRQQEQDNAQLRTAMEVRVRGLEMGQARTDEKFNSMMDLLQKIDGRLERIERRD